MNFIPEVKSCSMCGGTVNLSKIKWIFDEGADERVSAEAYAICPSRDDGTEVRVRFNETESESYHMEIGKNGVVIESDGARGAFYALQTLKQLLNHDENAACMVIDDAPDMKYRGFYHDVTRGKVPTLGTLKELADTLASLKMNSMQLYIEHTFEFKEYEYCRDKLGYLTKDEIRELDEYCRSKFIDLIPSVSSFGHLYHLLSGEKYRHLSELPDYVPTRHYWYERMQHHTINPQLDESFEVIKSLIDQFSAVTVSDKFNICCDETFDLGNGVNKGADKGELYLGFVKKLIAHLTAKGKTVMMWGDIILQHPECIGDIPENVIFLNWGYDKNPSEEQYRKLYESGRTQILCPATSAWFGFSEDIRIEEGNIMTLAKYAYKYNAEGMLLTNWGDLGNPASLTMSMYGLMLAAAVSWNRDAKADAAFHAEVSERVFGNTETVDLIEKISDIKPILNWTKAVTRGDEFQKYGEDDYIGAISLLKDIREKMSRLPFKSDIIKRECIAAVDGYLIIAEICAKIDGYADVKCGTNLDKWCSDYSELWLARNKKSELDEVIRVIKDRMSR